MKLYEIDNRIAEILDKAIMIDPETGEVTGTDDELMAEYEQLQIDKELKIESIGLYIKNLKAEAEAIAAQADIVAKEVKTLKDRAKYADNRAERLKEYLAYHLEGEKFSTPRVSISYRRSKKVAVDQNRLFDIPDQYLRYKEPEVDKKAVSEALKAGQDVPGCSLVESVSMIIK